MKPKTGFEVILNYSSQCHKEKLQTESSAGANAASRANTIFSANDPLSEIVWTPDKGFSLKCVDSSFTNKNTSLLRDVEPSSMVLALLQSVTCTTDKPVEDVFVQPLAVICAKSDVSSTDTPARNSTSDSVAIFPEYTPYQEHDTGSGDNLEKINSAGGTSDLANGQKENLMNHWEKNICAQACIEIEAAKISEIMEEENKSSTISGQINQSPVGNLQVHQDGSKLSMEQNPSPRKHYKEGLDTSVDNMVVEIEDDSYTRVEHMIEDKGSNPLGTYLISPGINHSEKMDLTSQKDLQTFSCKAATSAATSRILVSKSNDNKNKSKVNEMMLPYNKNESHLSFENYHNPGLFLASRKRSKQEVIIASKRVKMQIQETSSYSKSYVNHHSSFMNLVSNMTKGYSQSSQDEEKSLALAHENPDRHLRWPHKGQAPEIKNSFKSNFQSTYCQCFENAGTRMSHQVGESSSNSLCRRCSSLHPQVEETKEQYADNQLVIETKKLQNCFINKEASSSIGLKDEKGNNEDISKHKFNNVTPFSRLRDSEAMVSMFAKRLGAIKQCQQTE